MKEFFRKLALPITLPLEFIQKYFKALIFILILVLIFAPESDDIDQQENLAKIYLYGPIFDAGYFLEEIERVDQPNIEGVLLIVDSPGGMIAPSIEIAEAVKRLAQKKKVVAYASGTMASGSYYASIWSDKIIANPGSFVGSIGVIFEGMNVKELIDKIGIKPQTLKMGKYKEAGTPFREWQPHEKEELERVLGKQYDMFVQDVAKARSLDPEQHETFADGRIFTSAESAELGLIDRVGTIHLAQNELYQLTGVSKPVWMEESDFEKFYRELVDSGVSTLLRFVWTIH